VPALQFGYFLLAPAFDHRQDAPGHVNAGRLAGTGEANEGHPHGQRFRPGAARTNPARFADETGSNAKQGDRHMRRRYTRATGSAKEPAMQRGRQCLNREVWQIAPPVIELRPIWLLPRAGFLFPAPRLVLVVGTLPPGTCRARKARKVRKGGGISPRWFAVRQIRVRFLLACLNPTLDGFHRCAMTVLAQILICVTGTEQSVGHGFFINPVARDHPTHAESHGIKCLVAFSVRGGAEFRD
jgi:hypothetical protein